MNKDTTTTTTHSNQQSAIMPMNNFLTGILVGDLSRFQIVDDNVKVSRASRLKACSSFGRLDQVRKNVVRKDRWSRLARQEKDTALVAKTKRPKLLKASSSACLGEQRKVSRVSSESSLSMPRRRLSPIRVRDANATWDTEDTAQPKMNKAKDSMLCLQRKRMESPVSQGNNGKNASWDNKNRPQKNQKPSAAMMSLLILEGSGGSGMSMSKSTSAHTNLASGMSSRSSNNPGGTKRSSSTLGGSSAKTGMCMSKSKSAHTNLGSTMSSQTNLGSGMSKPSNNPGGMTRSSNTLGGKSSTKTNSLRSALGSMAPSSTMKRSSQKAPNSASESSSDGNATFKTYRVPSKSSLLVYPPRRKKMPSMSMDEILDRPLNF